MSDNSCQILLPASSRHVAMEWGLVLISQGLPSTVGRDARHGGWTVAVEMDQASLAREVLAVYAEENKRLEKPKIGTGESFGGLHWMAYFWATLLIFFYVGSPQGSLWREAGVFDVQKVMMGQGWRFLTAVFLHADLAHLASNLSVGIILFGMAFSRFGVGVASLVGLLCGVGGNLFGLWLHSHPYIGLGASGGVMGMLGLLMTAGYADFRARRLGIEWLMRAGMAGAVLFGMWGMNPNSDMVAHFGGFMTGLGIGVLFFRSLAEIRSRRMIDDFCFLFAIGGMLIAWAFALRL